MRLLLLLLIILVSVKLTAQIKVYDMGHNWKPKVDSALLIIKNTDIIKYNNLTKYCKTISFWNGNYSTVEDSTIICISIKDIEYSSINNISAILVHESKHLEFINTTKIYSEEIEEIVCYEYELDFLKKIDNIEPWLIEHVIKMIKYYEGIIK
jgi:hypothetical protein